MTRNVSNIRLRLKQWRRQLTYSDGFLNYITSFARFLIRIYIPCLKIQHYYHPDFLKLNRNKAIYAFWHGRLLLLVPCFGTWHVTIMTDLSWAGEFLARILTRFGYIVVRGSSKRGGFRGLLQMKTVMEEIGGALAVDGPHGPVYQTKPGVLLLSRKLGYPIVPVTYGTNRAWLLKKTWDRFLIPKPFAKCIVAMGRPIWAATEKNEITSQDLDRILTQWTAEMDMRLSKT